MKKVLSILVSILAVTLLLASCSKSTEKILTKKNGKWDIIETYNNTYNGVAQEPATITSTITFDDKTFTYTDFYNNIATGSWSASKDKVTLIVNGGDAVILDIVESKKNSQEWKNERTINDDGDIFVSKGVWKLTRK